jgi:glycosidase
MDDNAPWMEDQLWYKDAVIYELHIKAFFDSDNNGTGDFAGLIHKLDYLQNLGVNPLWLLPFYPSPMRDDGYVIVDYHNIHPEYGSMVDFKQVMKEAHRSGFKVITELVINHTSDQHPWFKAALRAPAGSCKSNFYVWFDTNQKFPETPIIFTDTEKSNWTWDEEAPVSLTDDLLAMGCHNHDLACFPDQNFPQLLNLFSSIQIQVSGGFIGKYNIRVMNQSADYRNLCCSPPDKRSG